MKRIQAKKHKIGTYEIDKISLSYFDDKRFLLDNGVNTLAYFYKNCNKKIVMAKKSCHNRQRFLIVEKIYDNEKRLVIMEKYF